MSKIENIKNIKNHVKYHVKRNKAVYITGATCLAVGTLGGGLYMATRPEMMVQQKNLLVWKPRQEVIQVKVAVEELSTPSKPIMDQVTKTVYNSISDAVRQTGRTRTSILKDPNFQLLEELVEASA